MFPSNQVTCGIIPIVNSADHIVLGVPVHQCIGIYDEQVKRGPYYVYSIRRALNA